MTNHVARNILLMCLLHLRVAEYPEKFVGAVREFMAAAFGQQQTRALPSQSAGLLQLVPVGDTMPAAAVGVSQAEDVREQRQSDSNGA